ncbi:MAG: hypothetical protein ACJ8AO_15875 [Gemmatimonadaceae bacterium]
MTTRTLAAAALAATVLGAGTARAQSATPAAPLLTPAQLIASAVLPLPPALREGATVLRLEGTGATSVLRRGAGAMICLTDSPTTTRFHVACYHRDLEPFMARGRALRMAGITSQERVDSARFAEIQAGTLKMPGHPSSLYSLTGPADAFDPATGEAKGASALHVVYIPFATSETTGLSTAPARGSAWLMSPGTPKAHIMFTPTM